MEADQDRDGKISFDEFTKMVENTDVSMSMTLGIFIFFAIILIRFYLTNCGEQTSSKNFQNQNLQGICLYQTFSSPGSYAGLFTSGIVFPIPLSYLNFIWY